VFFKAFHGGVGHEAMAFMAMGHSEMTWHSQEIIKWKSHWYE